MRRRFAAAAGLPRRTWLRVDIFGLQDGGAIDGRAARRRSARMCRRCDRARPTWSRSSSAPSRSATRSARAPPTPTRSGSRSPRPAAAGSSAGRGARRRRQRRPVRRTSSTSTCSTARDGGSTAATSQDIFVPLYNQADSARRRAGRALRLRRAGGLTAPIEVEVEAAVPQVRRASSRRYSLGARGPGAAGHDHRGRPHHVSRRTRVAGRRDRRRRVNAWERWNDYGIGLLLEGTTGSEKGELRQAADAFAEVERLGRPDGAAEPRPRLFQGGAARRSRERAAARRPQPARRRGRSPG